MMKIITPALALLALGACGSDPRPGDYSVNKVIGKEIKELMVARATHKAGGWVGYTPLTQAQIDAIDVPLIRVGFPKSKTSFIANEVAQNGNFKTYKTTTGHSFVFNKDRLAATRGFRHDLMIRAMNDVGRKYQYLSPEYATAELRVDCERQPKVATEVKITETTYAALKSSEVCKGTVASFKNDTWRTRSGKILKAHQWVGPEMGFAIIEYLN